MRMYFRDLEEFAKFMTGQDDNWAEEKPKVEDKSDEKLGLKQDVEVVEKEYKTFRDKYNA